MPSVTTASFYLLIVLAITIQFFLPSPKPGTIMSPSKPWADTPCALITTPQYATKKVTISLQRSTQALLLIPQADIFTIGATHMAHIHNAILRGYNSIYLQALHVQDTDKAAFIGYALSWYRFVKSHHDDEETELFPAVEELLGSKSIWEDTHAEHGTRFLSTSYRS